MIGFNPHWGGLDYVQDDSVPPDSFAISFVPSIVNDATAGALQANSESSVLQDMQAGFRLSAENMMGAGLMVSSSV